MSEEEDEEGDAYPVDEIESTSDVDNLFKALEDASHGVEITDERYSLFISTICFKVLRRSNINNTNWM